MRAISPIARYSIQLVESIPKRGMDKSGTVVEYSDDKPVIAEFRQGGLTEWEQIAALEHFDFSGLPEGVNPLTRVSMFDTEAAVANVADPSEREAKLDLLDQRLEYLQAVYPSEFRIVEKPATGKPWPHIDTTPLEDMIVKGEVIPGVLSIQRLTGHNPEEIRLYFVEHPENPESPAIIAAMEQLEAEAAGLVDDTIRVTL